MVGKINIYLLEYTLKYILRYKSKNIFIVVVMSLLVGLLASVFFISNAMKNEYKSILSTYPDIIITNQKAMRESTILDSYVDDIYSIEGVSSVVGRVWGKYYFAKEDKIFYLFAKEEFETYANPLLNDIDGLKKGTMLISQGVKDSLEKSYYKEYFNFIKSNGELKKITIAGIVEGENALEKSSMIILPKQDAQEIFDYKDNELTDIAVSVANKSEIAYIAAKITTLFPSAKIEIKKDLLVKYGSVYNFRSGFFLTIFTISLFTFFMIVYDKVNGINSEQRLEIGVLKAIGWRVEDVLNAKLYEGLIISIISYILGITMAFIYVYIYNGFYLKEIFLNNYDMLDDFPLNFMVDYETLFLLFFLSVPVYVIATIIPSWRVATLDADEVMR